MLDESVAGVTRSPQCIPGMARVTLKKFLKSACALIIFLTPPVAAQQSQVADIDSLPSGLESYLEARILEANGKFREAMDAYDTAVQQAPDVEEIRLSYANFLVDVGMAEKAIGVLENVDDLGGEGLRIRALALAQEASKNDSLTPKAEVNF